MGKRSVEVCATSKLTIAPGYYPSSKTCSPCATIKQDLTLKDRVYHCDSCGHTQDRDLNAAINLRKKAVSYTASACGVLNPTESICLGSTTKQEANTLLFKFG